MARRNATATVCLEDENPRPLDQPSMPTGDAEGDPVLAIHDSQAIQANAKTEEMLTKQDSEMRQTAALAVVQSARLGASAETSRPLGHFKVFEDSISCGGATQPPTANARAARPRSPLAPVSVIVPANETAATTVSPDCSLEYHGSAGEAPVVLDTSLHAQPIWFSDLQELESDLEYARYIYLYLRKKEHQYRPSANYIQQQPDITASMRTSLVDWLVEVSDEYNLHAETLFRAVAYVDRFLSTMSVGRNKLRLFGSAALMIAAKFEEIYPPKVEDFLRINHGAYSLEQILKMETVILNIFGFDVSAPTINYFLLRFAEVNKAPEKAKHLGQYICELALLDDHPYLQYLPSIIAGSSLCLANHMLGRRPWGEELVEYSGYELTSFRECVYSLHSSLCKAPNRAHRAVHEKFSAEKFHEVAKLEPSATLPF